MKILLALVLLVAAPQAPAAVAGLVLDGSTQSPVAGARILLARVDGALTQSVVVYADDQGRFAASTVPPGTYRVFADDPGYLRKEHSAPVVVRAGRPAVQVSIALTRLAVIAGQVVSERGDPAPKIWVRAWNGDRLAAETQTNDLGEYRLFGLPPGLYVVGAERYLAPSIDGTRYVIPTPPCPDCPGEGRGMQALTNLMSLGSFIDPRVIANRAYPPVFFPSAATRATATPIELGPGQQVVGIQIRLMVR